MYRSVLVPLDGSAFSAAALPIAAAFARKTGAELHLVAVYDPSAFLHLTPGDVNLPLFLPNTVDERCELLRSTVLEQAASISNTGLKATGTLLEGTIVEALAEHAEFTHADLVIMATHGRAGIDRLRIGSVASSFLSRSPVPVFLVRPASEDSALAAQELPHGALLVPLDGSAFAETMLLRAAEFANALGLSIELVTVSESNGADNAHHYLERVAAAINPPPSVPPVITVLSGTSAAHGIIIHTMKTHPAAIAMATHGRSGIIRLVLGSVADNVLKGVDCPMLVYRPDSETLAS